MRSEYHHVDYRPMPSQSRFGLVFGVLHNEACYTPEELEYRARVLRARASSGLDSDLLQTSNSWFSSNQDAAFVNINEQSWFFSAEYQPREGITTEAFHIPLIESQRLHWPELGTMTRVIGDYLLLRNSNLAADHLNQPMNYVLLDVVQMLNRLSKIENPEHVANQLQLLHNYLRAVEIHTSPTIGSDRLFLADCRRTFERHQTKIENQIHSRQLKAQIHKVQQQLTQVAELRHTVLHFALIDQPVNAHPYWEHFASHQPQLNSKAEFPTLAAKNCATHHADEVTKIDEKNTEHKLVALELSAKTLDHCQDFKFVDNLPGTVKKAYSDSLVDLQEILRFQGILDQLQQLFDQAGEVFTIIQFREQMLGLLQNIEKFIQDSHQTIVQVLEANANIYHQSIQAKQDLQWWEKLLTDRQKKIDDFINNQDNLARFDVTLPDLHKASKDLFQQVNQAMNYLTQQAGEKKQLELISSTRGLVQQLMNSMHAWIGRQYELKGLSAPEKISLIEASKTTEKIKMQEATENSWDYDYDRCNLEPEEDIVVQTSSANRIAPLFQFWFPSNPTQTPNRLCAPGSHCGSTLPMLEPGATNQDANSSASSSAINMNASVALGVLILLPLGILALKLLYDSWYKPKSATTRIDDAESFNTAQIQTADLLSIAQNQAEQLKEDYWQDHVDMINSDYEDLLKRAQKKIYDVEAMKDLYEELTDLLSDMENSSEYQLR
ncbi:Uncharacterised protein [Legionella lansingensis]|uniref:Uncharacterized protein n=1 Tax=Legionella lansingensis TaxID=45067 RepID=A0A0W0VF61_9GAMM|nr:hypothetical protein [Legionella lansingensis]KTD18699.1 hypothetical protein Llan_2302 [Legionella lansingensis]SNV57423.1 Uncharacterised protein [Legionella lansingensis]